MPVLPGVYVDPDAGTTLLGALDGLTAAVENAGDEAGGRSNVVAGLVPLAGGGTIAAVAADVPGMANMEGFGAALVGAGVAAAPLGSVNPPAGTADGVGDGDGDPDDMLNVVGAEDGAVEAG